MKPQVRFRTKPETIYSIEDSKPLYWRIKVPNLGRKHCDMHWFRNSKAFGGFANSDMFPSMLNHVVRFQTDCKNGFLKEGNIHERVKINQDGFLWTVEIYLKDERR